MCLCFKKWECVTLKKRISHFNQNPQNIMYHLQWPHFIFQFDQIPFDKLTFNKCSCVIEISRPFARSTLLVLYNKYLMWKPLKSFTRKFYGFFTLFDSKFQAMKQLKQKYQKIEARKKFQKKNIHFSYESKEYIAFYSNLLPSRYDTTVVFFWFF